MIRTIGPVLLVSLVGCDGSGDTSSSGSDRTAAVLATAGTAAAGAGVYATNCQSCHMADGSGSIGPALSGPQGKVAALSDAQLIDVILTGTSGMPPYGSLSDQQLADLLAYMLENFDG
ncbi:MAG: cytochrome c [Myxococcota bacterium]